MADASSYFQRPVAVRGRRVYPSVDAAISIGADKQYNCNAECDAPPIGWDSALTPNQCFLGSLRNSLNLTTALHKICVNQLPSAVRLYSCPFAVFIRVHSRLNLPHSNTGREPSHLFLSQLRGFELTFLDRKRTTRMETATGGWI